MTGPSGQWRRPDCQPISARGAEQPTERATRKVGEAHRFGGTTSRPRRATSAMIRRRVPGDERSPTAPGWAGATSRPSGRRQHRAPPRGPPRSPTPPATGRAARPRRPRSASVPREPGVGGPQGALASEIEGSVTVRRLVPTAAGFSTACLASTSRAPTSRTPASAALARRQCSRHRSRACGQHADGGPIPAPLDEQLHGARRRPQRHRHHDMAPRCRYRGQVASRLRRPRPVPDLRA